MNNDLTQIPKLDLGILVTSVAEFARGEQEIDVLYLFGSHAFGRANELSDIDLGILLNHAVPSNRYFELKRRYSAFFSRLFSTDKIDVVILNEASLHLAFSVVSPREIIFERDPARRIRYELKVVNGFLDFRPMLLQHVAYARRQLAQGEFFG